jgi:NAD(P)-dependent dehydrogenase (short-subunit alcohol dehydrogenase family)
MPPPKSVIITGASTGIGKATALHLDRLGFRVFASVRKESDADALRAQASERLTPILLDVTDTESISRAKFEICRSVGDEGLWGIVNNAGIAFLSPLEFAPLDSLRRLFEVNVFGLLAVTQAFLPLVRQARGRVINVSSEAVLEVVPFHGPYSASKLAVDGFSDALRRELKPLGVQVSVVIAGSIDTPIWKKGAESSDQAMRRQPKEAGELYGKSYKRVYDYFMKMGRAGIAPQAVAREITRALTAKHAKNYYLIGRDAHAFHLVRTLVPEALQDWMSFQVLGLPQSRSPAK